MVRIVALSLLSLSGQPKGNAIISVAVGWLKEVLQSQCDREHQVAGMKLKKYRQGLVSMSPQRWDWKVLKAKPSSCVRWFKIRGNSSCVC